MTAPTDAPANPNFLCGFCGFCGGGSIECLCHLDPKDRKPADDLVERLEDYAKSEISPDGIVRPPPLHVGSYMLRGACAEAAARIRSLEAQRDEAVGLAEKLSMAISWLDYPFVDNNTPEDELRSRVGLMMKDAEPHRAFLSSQTEGR